MADNKYAKFMEDTFPLLTMMKEKVPGTLRHSRNVMDICVNIATELDLDKDLLQCAALYHDVGKIFNPEWFTENQMDKNPHDEAPAELSCQIVTRHVADSALLLSQFDFPVEIIKTVSSHHGSFVLLFFWKKDGASEERKDQFRYNTLGPPQDVYSNILMIVDRVEAAAKSLFNAGKLQRPKDRERLIDDVFRDLVEDDQLSQLTYGVGKIVRNVLSKELAALYHERIDYDKAVDEKLKEDKEKKKREKQEEEEKKEEEE